jgi:hypothetical protein
MLAYGDRQRNGDRKAELEAAIGKIRQETWKTGQTLPKFRRAIVYSISQQTLRSTL